MQSAEEQIKKGIVEALYWDNRIDASGISVEVNGTEANLSGTVLSFTARRSAEEDALCVPGVYSVKNKITIECPVSGALPDTEMQGMIEKVYVWNTAIDSSKIEVAVKEGIVRLKGTVGSLWELARAEDLADDIIGVISVINELAVVPTESYLDELIAKRITNAFERSIVIEVDLVNVKVEKGRVTLSGMVSSEFGLKRAYEIALQTAGVTFVENLIATR